MASFRFHVYDNRGRTWVYRTVARCIVEARKMADALEVIHNVLIMVEK